MNYDVYLGWLTYIVGLIWYMSVCMIAGQIAGGVMVWLMPLAGFFGWSLAAAFVRWRLQ
jgi:hypothetical protein